MVRAFVGLGTNLGDKAGNLRKALALLNSSNDINLIKISSTYESAPVGYLEQDWFINAVVEVETSLTAGELLELLLETENRLGRERVIRWGPRLIDLDLLLYGQEQINEPDLVVPHERMAERAFVMQPLAEIAPDLVMPDGKHISEIVKKLTGQEVRKVLSL